MAKPKGRLSLFFYIFFFFTSFGKINYPQSPFPSSLYERVCFSKKKKKKKSLPTKFSCQSLPINMVDQNNNYMMKR